MLLRQLQLPRTLLLPMGSVTVLLVALASSKSLEGKFCTHRVMHAHDEPCVLLLQHKLIEIICPVSLFSSSPLPVLDLFSVPRTAIGVPLAPTETVPSLRVLRAPSSPVVSRAGLR